MSSQSAANLVVFKGAATVWIFFFSMILELKMIAERWLISTKGFLNMPMPLNYQTGSPTQTSNVLLRQVSHLAAILETPPGS